MGTSPPKGLETNPGLNTFETILQHLLQVFGTIPMLPLVIYYLEKDLSVRGSLFSILAESELMAEEKKEG